MKHLFVVHSSIAWLISKKIMEVKHLDKRDCVFCLLRGFLPQDIGNYQHFQQSVFDYGDTKRIWAGINFIKTAQNLKYFDSQITMRLQDKFYAYFPYVETERGRLLISHKNCIKYFMIEEGTLSYANEAVFYHVRLKRIIFCVLSLFFPRFYKLKGRSLPINHPKFGGCIGCSKKVFPTVPRDKVSLVPLPFNKIKLDLPPDAVLVLDHIQVFHQKALSTSYFQLICELADYLTRNDLYKTIGYKFHPRHYVNYPWFVQNVRKIFNNKNEANAVRWIELGQDVSLENVAFTYHPVFYGLFSSALLYAAVVGCEVWGVNDLLLKKYKGYGSYLRKEHSPSLMPQKELNTDIFLMSKSMNNEHS